MRRMMVWILIVLMAAFLAVPAVAMAEGEDYFSYSAKVTPDTLSGAGSVQLSVTLNCPKNSAFSMYGVKIVKGSTTLMSMGDILPGSNKTQEAAMNVSRDELGDNIPLKITWMEDNARPKEQSFSVYVGAAPGVNMTRSLPTGKVKAGDAITIKYTISNTGTLGLSNLKLTDFGVTVGTLNALDAGSTYTFSYGTAARDGMESQPKLTYESGGKTYTAELDKAAIQTSDAKLSVQLDVDNAKVDKGDKVNLRCTITNVGNTAFKDVKVTDMDQKVVFTATALPVSATRVFTVAETVNESKEYVYNVTATDDLGGTHNVSSNKVQVSMNEEVQEPQVEMSVKADAIQLTTPGTVNFEITVQNKGIDPVPALSVVDGQNKLIKYFPSLVTGSQTIDYAVDVAGTQTFVFFANINQGQPTQKQLSSQSIEIKIAANEEPTASPTVTPQVSEGAAATAPPAAGAASRLNMLFTVIVVIVVLLLVALFVLGLLVMLERRRKAALLPVDVAPEADRQTLEGKELTPQEEEKGVPVPPAISPDGFDDSTDEIWDNTQDIPPLSFRPERPIIKGEEVEELKHFNPESFDREEDVASGHTGFLPNMGQRSSQDSKRDNKPDSRQENKLDSKQEIKPDHIQHSEQDIRLDHKQDSKQDDKWDNQPDNRKDSKWDSKQDYEPDSKWINKPDHKQDNGQIPFPDLDYVDDEDTPRDE